MDPLLPRRSPAGRRLAELLREQQEPFLLDVYLLEHGCSRALLCPEAAPMCWPGNARRRLQRLARHGFRRRRKGILRSLLALFVHRRAPRASNWDSKAVGQQGHPADKRRKAGSSADRLTRSTARADRDLGKIKVDAERNKRWECTEECKQLSPVSVLELPSDDESPTHCQAVREEDPSTSGVRLPIQVSVNIHGEPHGSAIPSKAIRTKRELHRAKQPLLACVEKEDEHMGAGHEAGQIRDQHFHEIVGSCRTGLTRSSRVFFARRTQGATAATVDRLVESDVLESRKEWRAFHPHMAEVSAEIGDEIFDDLAQDFASHMTDLFSGWKRC